MTVPQHANTSDTSSCVTGPDSLEFPGDPGELGGRDWETGESGGEERVHAGLSAGERMELRPFLACAE